MLSLQAQRGIMRENDHGDQLQRERDFPQEIILMGVRWYVAYPLSSRHVEELREERGVELDHATIHRWVSKYSPLLEEAFHPREAPGVGQLAPGRNLHEGEGRVALSVSRALST